jgi:RHS repeat-associated protein
VTQREYTWLDDLPVAVVDAVATSPVIYYVHTDHLFRSVAMTDAGQNIAWSATYTLFGAVQTIATPATTLNMRSPGKWFQLETGLHYNWHRHYDPTTGRYLQPDSLIVDDGAASVKGLPTILTETTSSVGNGALIAGTMGIPRTSARALLPDGLSVYGYARQSTIASVKNCGRMSRLRAPMAIRRPISWVRMVTADRGTAKIDPKMKADRVYPAFPR